MTTLPAAVPQIPPNFEHRLVEALQPIRQWALASCLHHLFDTGLYDALAERGPVTAATLADDLGFDDGKLTGFLVYLRNEDYVTGTDEGWSLSGKGAGLADFRPWYTLLVGGYTKTFQQAGPKLAKDSGWTERDGKQVGVGSCGISRYDAIPLARELLGGVPGDVRTVVDVGCGDGRYLIQLCQAEPDLIGVGLDPDPQTIEVGRKLTAEHDLSGRISLGVGRLGRLGEAALPGEPDCFITAFILQELLEQGGAEAVRAALRDLAERFPAAHLVVIEVDHRPDDPATMAHGLGLAYYNPYYLIHQLTEQKLETTAFWEQLFADSGLRVVAKRTTDARVDSTGLEVGYLLTSDRNPRYSD